MRITFQTIPKGKKPLNEFQYVDCHTVFKIKIGDFYRMTCLVAIGYMTHTPDIITYSSVVTQETMHIAPTKGGLYDLEVKAADVLNGYVAVPIREKIWTVLDPEFGDNAGKSAIIVGATYGLKSKGAFFQSHLAQFMQKLEYKSCDADPDLLMKADYRQEDKF